MSSAGTTTDVKALLADAGKAANDKDWNRAADLLADGPDTVEVLHRRSFYLSRSKRHDEARATPAILREREPKNFLWQHMTGYQYYDEQRFDEAVPWFIAAYRRNPDH